jgi:hypothetical protein
MPSVRGTCYGSIDKEVHIFLKRSSFIMKNNYLLRHACPSVWNNSAPTGRISMKFDTWGSFKNLSRKFKFDSNRTRIASNLHEDLSPWILLRMRNFFTRAVEKNTFLTSIIFSRHSSHLGDNMGKHKMHFCISTATIVAKTRDYVTFYIPCLSCFCVVAYIWCAFDVVFTTDYAWH